MARFKRNNVQLVIDAIKHETITTGPKKSPVRFSMSSFLTAGECGTSACIAGHVAILKAKSSAPKGFMSLTTEVLSEYAQRSEFDNLSGLVADFFGITTEAAHLLCYGEDVDYGPIHLDKQFPDLEEYVRDADILEYLDKADALKTLYQLRDTGEVMWDYSHAVQRIKDDEKV